MSVDLIRIPGVAQVPPTEPSQSAYSIEQSIAIGSSARGTASMHEIKLTKDNVLELVFDDQTTWFCDSETIEEIFPEATASNRDAQGAFVLSPVLQPDQADRGLLGSALLKMVNVLSKKKVKEAVRDFAEDLERKQLNNLSGLFRVDSNFNLSAFAHEPAATTYLLFIHGTNSSTTGSFGELVKTKAWADIQQGFGKNIIAFQHETLSKSPLQNVLELIHLLPAGVSVSLVTHSRGGLVGDILARFTTSDGNNRGFTQEEINYLKKERRNKDVSLINEIDSLFRNKKITLNRYVRVACPANGTTLASKRLDRFFNVTFNLLAVGLNLVTSPIYLAFKNLIVAAIDSKNDVEALPGIEAMNPDSPFLKVLNNPSSSIRSDAPLFCISGNSKAKLNLKALKILAGRLFFQKDNDLVVNTLSMYQGSRRLNAIYYLLDEGSQVDHFHYFENDRTARAISEALRPGDVVAPAEFKVVIQEQGVTLDRNALLKLEGGRTYEDFVSGTKPILVLLPGIMGSNLSAKNQQLWINYLNFLSGGLMQLQISNTTVKATSLVGTSYKKFVKHFQSRYDVVTYPFDWRMPMTVSASAFNQKIIDLLRFNQPIKLVGHSMGGVLIRDFIAHHPDTWAALSVRDGTQVLFLGAPLGGSFRIPLVLFGRDAIIDKLAKLDILHTKTELLAVFNRMPGLLNLLPHATDAQNDFSNGSIWTAMRSAAGDNQWPLPIQTDLDKFKTYRDKVQGAMQSLDFSKMVYIAGKDKSTPCGYSIEGKNGSKELVFLSTAEGDQSVTWATGIPAKMIDDNSVYYVNVTHGALANEPSIFKGIEEILQNGSTNVLSKTRPVVRGAEKLFRTPEPSDLDLSETGVERTLLSMDTEQVQVVQEAPIRVYVSHGDLRFASYPVMAGHFSGDAILYAEKAIDNNLNGRLSHRHALGLYPGEIGTNLYEAGKAETFPGALIIGLGEFGSLTSFQLTRSVEQAVCNYLLELGYSGTANKDNVGLTILTIGCGYGGLTIDGSLRAVLQGIQNGNQKIASIKGDMPAISMVEVVEQYEDRAVACFHTITRLEKITDKVINIIREKTYINKVLGRKRRLADTATDEWYSRITVEQDELREAGKRSVLRFTSANGGARQSQEELFINGALIEGMLERMSVNNSWSADSAKTVFELFIPNNFKEQLKRQCNLCWVLDNETAAYPWELLQDETVNTKPLCINAEMIRQLTTRTYRQVVRPGTTNKALVIGDPNTEGYADQLPGALKEAQQAVKLFEQNGIETVSVLEGSPDEIVKQLYSHKYQILHLAGHGIFTPNELHNTGMLIGNGIFLTPQEFEQMSYVPEFVFINCCYLGAVSGSAEKKSQRLYRLAANIGTQLIQNGVKAVIAAGWAVNDDAALAFMEKFYEEMFAGNAFGAAVLKARQHVYFFHGQTNTWGAYQCYGDMYYKFREREVSGPTTYSFIIPQQAEIELSNLQNEIYTGKYQHDEVLVRLNAIADAVEAAELRNATINELEAGIYADLGEYEIFMEKYEMLLTMEEATFTVKSLERYCNVSSRKIVQDYINKKNSVVKLRRELDESIEKLKTLSILSATSERNNLLGSAYKRKAFIASSATQKISALSTAAEYYRQAFEKSSAEESAYPLSNWYVLEAILTPADKRKSKTWKLDPEAAMQQLQNLRQQYKKTRSNIDFWDLASTANISLAVAIIAGIYQKPGDNWNMVMDAYKRVWERAGAKGHKLAEIEHLDILIDGLNLIKQPAAKKVLKNVQQLQESLKTRFTETSK